MSNNEQQPQDTTPLVLQTEYLQQFFALPVDADNFYNSSSSTYKTTIGGLLASALCNKEQRHFKTAIDHYNKVKGERTFTNNPNIQVEHATIEEPEPAAWLEALKRKESNKAKGAVINNDQKVILLKLIQGSSIQPPPSNTNNQPSITKKRKSNTDDTPSTPVTKQQPPITLPSPNTLIKQTTEALLPAVLAALKQQLPITNVQPLTTDVVPPVIEEPTTEVEEVKPKKNPVGRQPNKKKNPTARKAPPSKSVVEPKPAGKKGRPRKYPITEESRE